MGHVSRNESISAVPIRPNSKIVRAVAPYASNFKASAYKAWVAAGGATAKAHYPCRLLHGLAYRVDLPTIAESRHEARLRFVEPVSINFDTFPDTIHHEIIPMIWDCWPQYRPMVEHWIRKHRVNAVVFTSSQTADYFRNKCKDINVFCITEGIDTSLYQAGPPLKNRTFDLLEYGSIKRNFFHHQVEGVKHVSRANANYLIDTFEHLTDTLSDSKIAITLPRCDTEPEVAQGVETLTQRYWEVMLSGCVPLGRAPKELVDLLGYNPVINLDREHADGQVMGIIHNIDEYQPLVDRNRETALRMAPWEIRMKQVMEWLKLLGYQC